MTLLRFALWRPSPRSQPQPSLGLRWRWWCSSASVHSRHGSGVLRVASPFRQVLGLSLSLATYLTGPKLINQSHFETYARYGDILHFKMLGQHMIVLGSPKAMFELLEKRSANTSDRPEIPMMALTAMDMNITTMPYGERWRRHKRAFWQYFHSGAIPSYQPIQRSAAHRFLSKLLKNPSELRIHIRFTVSPAVVKVLFGIDVADDGDEILAIVEGALEWVDEAFIPGKYLVDIFPILQHVPAWVPGATVQRLAAQWRSTVMRLKEVPYRRVTASMASGEVEAHQSVVGQMIGRMARDSDGPLTKEAETFIKEVATVTVEGASDTMFSTMQTIFVAMSLYPEVQRKAHAELDAVVDPNRLPEFDDRDSLVYVNAIIKEALRWMNVLPFVIPHMTTRDEEYRGYFIPAGTLSLPNVAAYMHDPNIYEDPEVFRPERFIRDGKLDFSTAPDPAKFVFGFGRRICSGASALTGFGQLPRGLSVHYQTSVCTGRGLDR